MIPMHGVGRDNQPAKQNRNSDITNDQAEATRLVVDVARVKQIKTVRALIAELHKQGVTKDDAGFGLQHWRNYA